VKAISQTITSSIDGDNKIVQILDATKVEQTNPVASIKGTLNYGKNGIVHIIDKVLYSQEIITALEIDTRPSILEWATSTEDLSSLVDALKKAGLADTVTGLEESTVLAPNNAAFTNLFSTLGDDYNSLEDFDNAELAVGTESGGFVRFVDETAGAVTWEWSAGYKTLSDPEQTVLASWVSLVWPSVAVGRVRKLKAERRSDGIVMAKVRHLRIGTRAQMLAALKAGKVRARNGGQ